ncbi:DUF5977 domain-containing protein [Mucilaginibacter sp. OK098]|uniref:DUF5977 domain-containing protein n=1 Tax=Mucilaginibacter sp. OK098 TaxID=1855297 RepID=UPI000932F77C|nr:DUF5977 domain-containing protein [Mucilaginibacter sp. OK098]
MKVYANRLLAILTLPLLSVASPAFAQSQNNYSIVDNLHPITPTAFQFTKYTELPVSEYTGLPNVSIPLYEIEEDGIKVPLTLTYQANGIRVNQDASWVGLGWDLQVGSIIQQINDQDDGNVLNRMRPDFQTSGLPSIFPYKYQYCNPNGGNLICNYACSGTLPINPVVIGNGMYVYTADYAPFNGNYIQPSPNFFDDHNYLSIDSEPDIYTASFPGHSFKFIFDWDSNQFVALDKKGYKISRDGGFFTVTVPSGEIFTFAVKSTVSTSSSSQDVTGYGTSSTLQPSSITWLLTQITTKNKKVITFNYNTPPTTPSSCYPTFTQKGIIAPMTGSAQSDRAGDWINSCYNGNLVDRIPTNGVLYNASYSQERYFYLNSIVFPKGEVDFTLSNRNDMLGGMKLDNMSVSTSQQVKSYLFNYSYFDATSVGGNTFTFGNSTDFGSTPLYRLQLSSLQDNSGATHTFTYNPTQLPAKNSFATDYWGFYNGRTANTTAVPNGSQFVNAALGIDNSAWGNNGDNHSANITYATAGILQKIQYPTGGSVNFSYELNQFNNYWVPGYSSSSNTLSSGLGVRIGSVTFLDAVGTQLKKTNYTYSGGLAIMPLNFFRTYIYTTIPPGNANPGNNGYMFKSFTVKESNMSGFFSANPFASINGVGYDQVTKTDVDASNNTNGKTVTNYFNNKDLVYESESTVNQISPTMPAYKNRSYPENGSIKSIQTYDSNNALLKGISNTYYNDNSALYYGARVFGYASLVTYNGTTLEQTGRNQAMVGYYPIFDFETLLGSSTETDYFGTDSVATTTSYSYGQYNFPVTTTKTNSTFNEFTQFSYPYNNPSDPVLVAMTAQNRLSDPVTVVKSSGIHGSAIFNFTRSYQQIGSLFVPSQDIVYIRNGNAARPTTTSYDSFDPANGNIFQYTKNTLTDSYLYDYNKEYVIAEVKNAPYTSVAYTSFEADGKGRWKYSGNNLPDNTAPTGKKSYALGSGNIYRDSLNATQNYVVSYWSKNGAQSVNGSATSVQGYTYSGWTYFEHDITNPSGGTITVSGTGTIDELRLYPYNAQMTTYTYEPLVGITSQSDVGGKISYYEYDGSKRLLDIRDQSRNILKAYCYNYAGQSVSCGVTVMYSSAAKSGSFTKVCSGGYTGSTVNYNVAAGKYTSTMSQQDADNRAQADVDANGQNYANANGTCLQNVTFNLSNTTNSAYQVSFSSPGYSNTYNFLVPGSSSISIPAGTYSVDVYTIDGTTVSRTFILGLRAPIVAPRATFSNVNVSTGSSDLSLSIQ